MTHKQAKRRNKQPKRQNQLPKAAVARFAAIAGAAAVLVVTYQLSASLLDQPIHSIEVNGPFQRVTALQIEAAIEDQLRSGFLSVDLSESIFEIGRAITALPSLMMIGPLH